MTNAERATSSAAGIALLAALRADSGSLVKGAELGAPQAVPAVGGLSPQRADAVLAAWSGARLHAGLDGLLRTADSDLALLVGDWCFAHALQALAHSGDLEAIGILAGAIGRCAVGLTESPDAAGHLTRVWCDASELLGTR